MFGDLKTSGAGLYEVCKWSFNPKANCPAYASNKTGGYKRRVAGVKDGSGSAEGKWDPANPIVATADVGTSITLTGYLTATVFYSIPAIIESLKVDVDIETGDFVSWTIDFAITAPWTNPAAGQMAMAPEAQQAGAPNEQRAGDVPESSTVSKEDVAELVNAQLQMAMPGILSQFMDGLKQMLPSMLAKDPQLTQSA